MPELGPSTEADKKQVESSRELNVADRRRLERRKSLPELFAESPFKGLNIEFDESEGEMDFGRDVDL
jgi:hypothetical protein